MKVALVYDRVNKFGGAERVVTALHHLFPDAPLYTLVHEPETSKWAQDIKVIPTFLNKVPFLRRKHEWLAPIAPLAFETHNLSDFDVVISVTSTDAKSVITRPHQLHICYCLTPTRYFWSGEEDYSRDSKMRLIPTFLKDILRATDLLTSSRVDEYIAISDEVRNRIKKYYNRESTVIYPAIEDKFYSKDPIPMDGREYFLIAGRLVPYKKTELAVKVFNKLKLPLVVVGAGSELERLKEMAEPNITFVGQVDDSRLIEYYRHAKAVIFPQEEDYGLIPLEAQAQGTPVIAYGKGGALETVIHNKTGIHFAEQTEESLSSAVKQFLKTKFNPKHAIENAGKFNLVSFNKSFLEKVNSLWEKHRTKS